jgi:hypothetical protein
VGELIDDDAGAAVDVGWVFARQHEGFHALRIA